MSVQQPDQLSVLALRISVLEQQIPELRAQIREYETARESDLKLQNVRDKLDAMSRDVVDVRRDLSDINTRFVQQQLAGQQRDAKQRERLDSLVIRVFNGAAGFLIAGVIAFLVNYFTHFIH